MVWPSILLGGCLNKASTVLRIIYSLSFTIEHERSKTKPRELTTISSRLIRDQYRTVGHIYWLSVQESACWGNIICDEKSWSFSAMKGRVCFICVDLAGFSTNS